MAKNILVNPIKSFDGKFIQVPVRDSNGLAIRDGDKLSTKDATIVDVLDLLILAFPRDHMTMENITEGVRMKAQITAGSNKSLLLDDSTHSWASKMLKDNAIGPKLFGFDLIAVIEALEDVEGEQDEGAVRKTRK